MDAMFQGWTNPCFAPPPPALPDLTALCEGVARLAAPPPLSHDALQTGRALPQVDRKFIPIVCEGILAMVDQHAAHERVRVEELREQVCLADLMDPFRMGFIVIDTERNQLLVGCWLVGWLAGWLLVGWLFVWLVGWLLLFVGRLVGFLVSGEVLSWPCQRP